VDSSVETKTDKLGRRTGPRRRYSVAEKLSILEEIRRPGASVADVARAHGINHNVVFGWRRLAQRGLLRAGGPESTPLRVESPTLLPSSKLPMSSTVAVGGIEVEFPGGVRVRVQGNADAILLERVFKALARR
jgi:transposase